MPHSLLNIAHHRQGRAAIRLVIGLAMVALLVGSVLYWYQSRDTEVSVKPITVTVVQDEFVAHVLDQGEVQSSENIEIRCEVKQRSSPLRVLELVAEGAEVSEGDFLVQLESTSFETELEQQKIALANAKTQVIQAETLFETAKASKLEYEEGTYVETRKTIENEIFDAKSAIQTALQELNQAKAVLAHSKKLQARGFITRQQLIADEFNVTKSEIAVEKGENSKALAKKKLLVLDEITRKKELVRLESDIRAAEVQLTSQREAMRVEEAREQSIKNQIANCTIVVPEGVTGQVVYAVERQRGDDWVLEKGIEVRQNQVLIRLPNPNKMEVKALVNEQSITRVAPNMPVSIQVDALNNKKLKGMVTKVNQYAESGGWMKSSVRKYAVFIQIVDPPTSLKPGMNASVSIQTNYRQNALVAPLQTVYGVQNRQFCLATRGDDDFETLEVTVGGDNSEMVMFESGVEEGTELVMNPAAYKHLMELPEIKRDRKIELPPGTRRAFGNPAPTQRRGKANARARSESRSGDTASTSKTALKTEPAAIKTDVNSGAGS
jgi:multidrug resistance efflux pump